MQNTYALVTTAVLKPGKLESLVRFENESSVPLMKSAQGFRGFFLLSDQKTGKVCGISLWDNKEAVSAGMQSDAAKALEKSFTELSADIFSSKPVRQEYIVSVQE